MEIEKLTLRTIIIAWQWSKSELTKVGEDSIWTTSGNECVIFSDRRDDPKGIAKVAEDYAKQGKVLICLHASSPHLYNYEHCRQIPNTLGTSGVRVRVRLFKGGFGPIYFDKSEFGILGTDGSLPIIKSGNKDNEYIESTLVHNREEKILNQLHFNHVWDAYWDTPADLLYRLAESFNFHTRGYVWQHGDRTAFLEHLKTQTEIWQDLHCFAELPSPDNMPWPSSSLEYNLKDFQSKLDNLSDTQLSETLRSAKEGVRNVLGSKPFGNENWDDTVNFTYNALFDLFKLVNNIA